MPAPDIDRITEHLSVLVDEIGPRPFGSRAEAQAAAHVGQALRASGWRVQAVARPTNQVACRGDGRRLILAHIDSVAESPGAVDNAAAVAVLLELARTTAATDLCVAFPDGEEVGLVGSTDLALALADWHPAPDGLELVVSTELLGQGGVAVMGLGAAWDDRRLGWLARALDPVPEVPFAYRVYSRQMPRGERSDHAPFALLLGRPSLLVFGRGDGVVFADYHQPADRTASRAPLAAAATTLDQLATAPPLPRAEGRLPDASTVVEGWLWPTWASWLTIAAGAVSAARDLGHARALFGQLWRALLTAAVAAACMTPWVAFGLFSPTTAEQTAAATMGLPPTGWWTGALPATLTGLVAFLAGRRLLGPRGSAPLAAGLLMLAFLAIDPLLAAPFGAAAVLARVHPLLALLPALYLLQPDILREFGFHGLVPPLLWGVGWLLAWPAIGRYPRATTRPAL